MEEGPGSWKSRPQEDEGAQILDLQAFREKRAAEQAAAETPLAAPKPMSSDELGMLHDLGFTEEEIYGNTGFNFSKFDGTGTDDV